MNNEPITRRMLEDFFKMNPELKPCRVELSNMETKQRWGTAWPHENRFTLYRHSVSVFLHEYAHLEVMNRGLFRRGDHHGYHFAGVLSELLDYWDTTPFREVQPEEAKLEAYEEAKKKWWKK